MVQSVGDEVFASMSTLAPAEKKVARALLADYPSAGLGTAAALAQAAGTSVPSVLRLLSRLKLGSYAEFRDRLLREVSEERNSPVSRAERGMAGRDAAGRASAGGSGFGLGAEAGEGGSGGVAQPAPGGLGGALDERAGLLGGLARTVPPGEFEAAVEEIVAARQVVLTGGYFSRYIVRILAMQLEQLITGVQVAEEPGGRDAGMLMDLTRNGVVVVVDMRRHELSARRAVALADQRGATTIVITDEELSPAAEDADIVLPVPVSAVPFDSFVPLLALVEGLVEAVFQKVGEPALERMRAWESAVRIDRAR